MSNKPWYWEEGEGNLFNRWSLVHFGAGLASYGIFRGYWPGLIAHTLYEFAEKDFFPVEARDTSMENHVGDTASFFAGMVVAKRGMTR